MIVKTESGSTYEFSGSKVRRINDDWSMRRDEDWLEVTVLSPIVIGYPMRLELEPLSEWADITTRTTSYVTEMIQ